MCAITFKDAGEYSRTTKRFPRIKDITNFDINFLESPWRSRTPGNFVRPCQQIILNNRSQPRLEITLLIYKKILQVCEVMDLKALMKRDVAGYRPC